MGSVDRNARPRRVAREAVERTGEPLGERQSRDPGGPDALRRQLRRLPRRFKGPSTWGFKGFYPRAPQFFQEGTDVNPNEAYAAIRDGVRYSGMGAWRDQLDDKQIWQLANFVASIKASGGAMKDMG
jgi:hypothetical protein